MSNLQNELILERAHQALDEYTNNPGGLGEFLTDALEKNDLDLIHYYTCLIEAELSQTHFYENGLMDETY